MPIDQAKIEKEITSGLKNERDDLEKRRARARSYDGDFDADFREWELKATSRRESRIFRRAIEVLTRHLYKDGPTRTLADAPDASEWLEAQYSELGANALLAEVDRLSLVNDVAAVEVYGQTGEDSAETPLGLDVWGSEDLILWLDPDNARKPGAVAVLDEFDESRRLRLWTRDQRVTYLTDKLRPGQTSGGTQYREHERVANPYGAVPFVFWHASYPARGFWTPGPGEYLRLLNYHINYRLTKSADDINHNRPIGVITGTDPDFVLPRDRVAGEFKVVPGKQDAVGNGAQAVAGYIVCDLGYVGEDWDDLQKFLDHALEMVGLPESSIRMEQASASSGAQVIAEQIPLVEWAEGRQRPVTLYEQRLAKMFLRVALGHAETNGLAEIGGLGVGALLKAFTSSRLSLRWPDLMKPVPGEERDQMDQFRLDNRLVSRTQLLMEREKLTRDEAESKLDEVSQDLTREQRLFASLDTFGMTPPAQAQAQAPGAPAGKPQESNDSEPTEDEASGA